MRYLFTAAYLLVCFLKLSAQEGPYQINGRIINAEGKTIYLSFKSKRTIDSTRVTNGLFVFRGTISGIELIAFKLENKRFPSALVPGALSITFDEKFNPLNISGQQAAADFRECQLKIDTFTQHIEKVRLAYQIAATHKDTLSMVASGIENDSIKQKRVSAIRQWVEYHPNSLIIPYLVQTELKLLSPSELGKLAAGLPTKVTQSTAGLEMEAFINSKRLVITGQKAPDFNQLNKKGKVLSLSSLEGSYVLLDFWASWCLPCRQDNRKLVEFYKKLKNKNFKIIGISLDVERMKWLNAIKKDHLVWDQVSDLKGWNNEVAIQYGIGALPTKILLDSDHKIIAINPDIKSIQAVLESQLSL